MSGTSNLPVKVTYTVAGDPLGKIPYTGSFESAEKVAEWQEKFPIFQVCSLTDDTPVKANGSLPREAAAEISG